MRRLLLVMGTALLLAAPADAATVAVSSKCGKLDCLHEAVFAAAAGEVNDLTIARDGAGYTFRDARNPVRAGRQCAAVDEHTARCEAPPNPSRTESVFPIARLGDGDDVAIAGAAGMFGGPGADRLEASHGYLSGGPGPDVVRATGERMELTDDDGALPSPDRYVGAGDTTLSYRGRRGPVRVDLRHPGRVGAAGEGDVAGGIRDVTGGRGDDVLTGDARANRLEGGPGADLLIGGAGDDELDSGSPWKQFGRAERDVLRGGPGRDQLELEVGEDPGPPQRAVCGSGRDHVSEPRPEDRVDPACERVFFGLQDVRLRAVMKRVSAPFAVSLDCVCRRATIEVRSRGRTIAAARARNRPVALRLNAIGRRLLAARRHLDVAVVYREYGSREGFSTRLSLLRRACGPPGSTLAASREARVYARGGTVFGCHRNGRRTLRLGARSALLGVRAAGRFAAVALRGRPLQVFDLRRGRVRDTSPERIPELTALRLTDGGVAAYIARRRDGALEVGSPGFDFTVGAPGLNPHHLRIAGRLIAWRSDGAYGAGAFTTGPAAGRGPVGSNGTVALEARRDELIARPAGGFGRAVRLGRVDCECISPAGYSGLTDVRLAGPFAAARFAEADFRSGTDRGGVMLADTRNGDRRETCAGEAVGSYVVTAIGGLACAVSGDVRQIRSGGAVIDEGRGIDLRSLRRRGEQIVWRHDGAERTAPLPAPG